MEGQETEKHDQVTFQDIGPCSIWWAMKLSFTRKRRLGALYKNKTLLKMCNFAQRLDHKHFLEFFALCLRQNHRFIIITMFSFQSKDERNVPSSCSLSLFFPINSNKVAAARLCRWLVYSLIIHTSQFVFQLYLYLNWTKMKSFNINILLRLPWHFKAVDNTRRTQVSHKNAREGKRPHVIKIFGRQALSFFHFPFCSTLYVGSLSPL